MGRYDTAQYGMPISIILLYHYILILFIFTALAFRTFSRIFGPFLVYHVNYCFTFKFFIVICPLGRRFHDLRCNELLHDKEKTPIRPIEVTQNRFGLIKYKPSTEVMLVKRGLSLDLNNGMNKLPWISFQTIII